MVEDRSMKSAADFVSSVRDGRLEDFVRKAIVLVTRELKEAEISAEVGAALGEVVPGGSIHTSERVSPVGVGNPGLGRSSYWSRSSGRDGPTSQPSLSLAGAPSTRSPPWSSRRR